MKKLDIKLFPFILNHILQPNGQVSPLSSAKSYSS